MRHEMLIELAERCEQATGPDRELDCDIAYALFGIGRDDAKPFTASLDAAVTLVPEGYGVCVEQERPTRACEASVSPPGTEPWGPGSFDAEAATLALALVAAALRARAGERP